MLPLRALVSVVVVSYIPGVLPSPPAEVGPTTLLVPGMVGGGLIVEKIRMAVPPELPPVVVSVADPVRWYSLLLPALLLLLGPAVTIIATVPLLLLLGALVLLRDSMTLLVVVVIIFALLVIIWEAILRDGLGVLSESTTDRPPPSLPPGRAVSVAFGGAKSIKAADDNSSPGSGATEVLIVVVVRSPVVGRPVTPPAGCSASLLIEHGSGKRVVVIEGVLRGTKVTGTV